MKPITGPIIMPNKPDIELPPDFMILNATRYAIGRMSYTVSETTEWLSKHWELIPQDLRDLIIRDIKREIDRNNCGMDIDRSCWVQIVRLQEPNYLTGRL